MARVVQPVCSNIDKKSWQRKGESAGVSTECHSSAEMSSMDGSTSMEKRATGGEVRRHRRTCAAGRRNAPDRRGKTAAEEG